jgi:hypothetical protein
MSVQMAEQEGKRLELLKGLLPSFSLLRQQLIDEETREPV